LRCTAAVPFDAEYLLQVPERVDERTLFVLTLHGYGSNPEAMLRLSEMALGKDEILASLRAPNQFYATGNPSLGAEIGYHWGTTRHAEGNIRLHHAMVRAISGDLRARFQIPVRRLVLMGFSQPVGLNYRFAGTYPDEIGGVIAVCGGVPRDWEEDKYGRLEAPVLHIARSEDEFFPEPSGFADRLQTHAANVEFHVLPGPHRFPAKAAPLVRAFTEKLKVCDILKESLLFAE
jgi:predicted esterase